MIRFVVFALFLLQTLMASDAYSSGTLIGCAEADRQGFSLCSLLRRDSGPASGASSTPSGRDVGVSGDGSVCVHSSGALYGAYSYCAGTTIQPGSSSDATEWEAIRALIAQSSRLPGNYNAQRGEAWGRALVENLRLFADQSASVSGIANGFDRSFREYTSNVIPSAATQTMSAVRAAEERLKVTLNALPSEPASSPSDHRDIPAQEDGRSLVTAGITQTISKLDSITDRVQKWSTLESLKRTEFAQNANNSVDQRTLEEATSRYFNSAGLVNEQLLGAELGRLSQDLGRGLQSNPRTVEGRETRLVVSKGLAVAANVNDEKRNDVYSGLALAIGADFAFADNRSDEGWKLLSQGAKIFDVAIGFVPVAGSVNDAAQIVFGMATGHDYAGHPMNEAEYALRGAGVVLGLLPAGHEILKFGEQIISPALLVGTRLLRTLGLQEKLLPRFLKSPNATAASVEEIGIFFRELTLDSADAVRESTEVLEETTVRLVENFEAKSVNANSALNRKLRSLQRGQKNAAKIRNLPDGRVRYYTIERPNTTPGPTRGAAIVTEYNPKTGDVRIWNECYDQAGNVNRVHPKLLNGQELDSLHFPPTNSELGL